MGLESARYISELDKDNPAGSDDRSTSDDHHRLTKAVIQETIPNTTTVGMLNYVTATGTPNALTLTLTPALFAYAEGMLIRFKAASNNTAATSIDVNSKGAKDLVTDAGNALVGGELLQDGIYAAQYDGTQFMLLGASEAFLRSNAADTATGKITFDGGLGLPNNTYLTIEEVDETVRNVLAVDDSDILQFGNTSLALNLKGSSITASASIDMLNKQILITQNYGAFSSAAIAVHDVSASGAAPWIQVVGRRDTANASPAFAGKVFLAKDAGSATYLGTNEAAGMLAFGTPQVAQSLDDLWLSAGIYGYASGAHASAQSSRPMGVKIGVGSNGFATNATTAWFDKTVLQIDHNGLWLVNDTTQTADDEQNVNFFGDGSWAQAGPYSSAVQIFGGGGETRKLRLEQDYSGDAIITASLVLRLAAASGIEFDNGVTFGKTAVFDEVYANGNSGAAKTITWSNGNKQKVTLSATCTFTFVAPSGPANLLLFITIGGAGGWSATWPGTVKWPGGVTPTLSTAAGSVDIISLFYDGTNYYGQIGYNFS